MKPSEIRQRVLSDHAALRQRLVRIEEHARPHARDETADLGGARTEAEDLLAFLAEHMAWEELHLVPLLLEADAWGALREERFAAEHREQRELLRYTLEHLQDPGRPSVLIARNLLDLVDLLRKDMEEEEAAFLDPKLVRDDPVSVDLFTG